MIEVREEGDGGRLVVVASGRLTEEDYRELVPRLHEAIERHGKLRLLILLRDFEGWTPKALIEDLRFDLRHRKDFERAAIVGERRWEEDREPDRGAVLLGLDALLRGRGRSPWLAGRTVGGRIRHGAIAEDGGLTRKLGSASVLKPRQGRTDGRCRG